MHILSNKPKALHHEKFQGSISDSHAPRNVIQAHCQTNNCVRGIYEQILFKINKFAEEQK